MQNLEPFDNWHYLYLSEDDEHSPFYGREYSEFEFSNTIYNYYIHPQWDEFGSRTLYLKVLMADYESGYMIIEMIGEWNDAIENDIMTLKREVVDEFQRLGINKFILIVENVLNFHSSDDSYYEEWFEDSLDNGGWAVCLNMPVSSQHDFLAAGLDRYIPLMEIINWRTMKPDFLFQQVDNYFTRRLNQEPFL
ncbi:MAG: hypothetical protein J5I50_04915 [Chitinophagaceae bacterium]|nr:hypothetical protein [Chitinophagaceae bacterium]